MMYTYFIDIENFEEGKIKIEEFKVFTARPSFGSTISELPLSDAELRKWVIDNAKTFWSVPETRRPEQLDIKILRSK